MDLRYHSPSRGVGLGRLFGPGRSGMGCRLDAAPAAKRCRPCPRCVPFKTKGSAVASQALDFMGGAKRDRTVDLYNAIVVLTGAAWLAVSAGGEGIQAWVEQSGQLGSRRCGRAGRRLSESVPE